MTPGTGSGGTPSMPYNSRRSPAATADPAAVSQPRAAGTFSSGPGNRGAGLTTDADGLGAHRPDPFGHVINPPRQTLAHDNQATCPLLPIAHRHPRFPRTAVANRRPTGSSRCPDPHRYNTDADVRRHWDERLRGDDGAISITMLFIGMVVILFVAALIGGGALFAARSTGFDLAQSAARAGAQQIDTATYRATGQLRLDPAKAAQAAKQFLAASGATGTVEVTAAKITVTATSQQATPMLAMFGHDSVTVTSTASATPTTGPPA